MSVKFSGVAFDLDGTLYSNTRFYLRLIPFMLRHWRLAAAMGRTRKLLHRNPLAPEGAAPESAALSGAGTPGRFYEVQAEIMAKFLGKDPLEIRKRTERLVYRGWEPVFGKLPLFPYVRDVLTEFRRAGLVLALLSDFPPEQKLINFGIRDFWDVILCSEEIGRLKPDPKPFQVLAERMGLPPERILYVGNSLRYDIRGARNAGMSAAWIRPFPFRGAKTGGGPGNRRSGGADFVFTGYRQLAAFVLN